jgi:hypothetical protein
MNSGEVGRRVLGAGVTTVADLAATVGREGGRS